MGEDVAHRKLGWNSLQLDRFVAWMAAAKTPAEEAVAVAEAVDPTF